MLLTLTDAYKLMAVVNLDLKRKMLFTKVQTIIKSSKCTGMLSDLFSTKCLKMCLLSWETERI